MWGGGGVYSGGCQAGYQTPPLSLSSFSSPATPPPPFLSHTHLHKPTSMMDPHMHSSKAAWRSALLSVSAAGRRHGGGEEEGALSACSATQCSAPSGVSKHPDLLQQPSLAVLIYL